MKSAHDPILIFLAIAAGIALTHVVTIAWHYAMLLPACADVCDEPAVMDNVCLCRHTDDGEITYTHPRSP